MARRPDFTVYRKKESNVLTDRNVEQEEIKCQTHFKKKAKLNNTVFRTLFTLKESETFLHPQFSDKQDRKFK